MKHFYYALCFVPCALIFGCGSPHPPHQPAQPPVPQPPVTINIYVNGEGVSAVQPGLHQPAGHPQSPHPPHASGAPLMVPQPAPGTMPMGGMGGSPPLHQPPSPPMPGSAPALQPLPGIAPVPAPTAPPAGGMGPPAGGMNGAAPRARTVPRPARRVSPAATDTAIPAQYVPATAVPVPPQRPVIRDF